MAISLLPAGLLKECRLLVSEANFDIGLHYKSNKPIWYDSAYHLWPRDMPLPVDGDGECVVAEEVIVEKKNKRWRNTDAF